MSESVISSELRASVCLITIQRPPVNALSNAALRQLVEILDECNGNPDIRAMVITGSGPYFCAGGDNKELRGMDAVDAVARVKLGNRLFATILQLDKPLVAAINGDAVGGGCEMVAFADHAVSGPEARFGMPEIRNGVLPMSLGIQRLVDVVGARNAAHVLQTGELMSARQAHSSGLVHEIVSAPEVVDKAMEWADSAAQKPAVLMAAIKHSLTHRLRAEVEMHNEATISAFYRYFDDASSRSRLAQF